MVLNRIFLFLLFSYGCLTHTMGQPSLSFEIKKPEKFENKKLGSEKTDEKKFTFTRRVIQNTVTHYNWYFNANNKLNEVIERAKAAHRDDYSQLLPFYNYSLDKTALDKTELDSVIYKANAGILIHDLRNAWIDNLYMLMGKAYYFKNQPDSAYLTFQYINFAFAPKEKDGYDKPIGSNTTEGATAFSISTKESKNVIKKAFTTPPSRNESLIWQIKTYLAQDALPEAAGLIETLKNDPVFPERLRADLHEVQAFWFYKQQMFDSAAVYLEKALPNAANDQETARWEYLIAQLYDLVNQREPAQKFYARAIKHTYDPVLEVYARLNAIRQNQDDEIAVQRSIDELLKMACKDRYLFYRDIIYFTAAQVELERNNIPAAKALLLRATQATGNNSNTLTSQRTNAFLLLGEIAFNEKNYADAKSYYDSVNINDADIANAAVINKRKTYLETIVTHAGVIYRQDSLQRIANMSPEEREAFIKRLVKQYRKMQGLKEETNTGSSPGAIDNSKPVVDLFGGAQKGEWYFYNASLKAKGLAEFKAKWGNRQNTDNWRRSGAISQSNRPGAVDPKGVGRANTGAEPADLSYEGLLKNVPLTPPQLATSNDSIEAATLALGKVYVEGLEDYAAAITTLEGFLTRFPESKQRGEALFNLYYSYKKTGDEVKANAVLTELQQKFAGTQYEKLVTNATSGKGDEAKVEMNKKYETIYNLFIEGRFEEALAEKQLADSLYGSHYWTPQLLYIQSIYHIRQRDDEEAKKVLQQIISLYQGTPLSEKAQTMLDVVNRRKEIEDYLTQLQIERPAEEKDAAIDTSAARINNNQQPVAPSSKPEQKPPVVTPPGTIPGKEPIVKKDSVVIAKPAFVLAPAAPHFVAIVLDKVDPVYVNETRNAFNRYNKEKYYNKVIDINNIAIDDNIKLVLMNNFENAAAALDYIEKTRKIAATEIIPWLPAGKYSFVMVTAENLEILKASKSVSDYKMFLQQTYPGKF